MKNQLAHPAVLHIATCLHTLSPEFAHNDFCQQATDGLDKLELKQRVQHIITVLHRFLPADYVQTVTLLKQVPAVWQSLDPDRRISSFAAWPLIDYASVYGLAHPEQSLDLLKTLTHLFSAEFAIRPFIVAYPEYCLSQFTLWVEHDSEHVRRLVSEGTRPRLPWGMQLKAFMHDPAPNIPLLSALKDDPSLYVRRSVANHLNDISKDNPDTLVAICEAWQIKASPQVSWIIRHATRSLVKAGNTQILSLLGYQQDLALGPVDLQLSSNQVQLGDKLGFSINLQSTSQASQNLVIDFAIHFVKASGQRKAKVFKFTSLTLQAGQNSTLHKNHGIKMITTRQYYAGTHLLAILINGQVVAQEEFELLI